MTGVSDLPFRQAASRLGAPYVATEMVACDSFARGRPDVVRRAAVGDGLPLMVIQLVGREAEWIAKGARLAEQAGADIIDFNMGCPAKEVTGALSGSALMRDEELASRLIGAAVEGTTPAGHAEDAAGLGRALEECARDRRACRSSWAWQPSPCMAAPASNSIAARPIGVRWPRSSRR